MSGQSDTGTNLLPDPYGFIRIRFQINRFVVVCFSKKYVNFIHRQGATDYWVIQAGLLTPLTFAWHHFTAFTWLLLLPVCTFFTTEGGDSESANFALPTLKAFFEACSHNVYGNKQ